MQVNKIQAMLLAAFSELLCAVLKPATTKTVQIASGTSISQLNSYAATKNQNANHFSWGFRN